MTQHGFARDVEFVHRDGKYVLVEDGHRDNYPCAFELVAEYSTQGNTLVCNWCGIADRVGFSGGVKERDGIHSLAPNETYNFKYSISIAE